MTSMTPVWPKLCAVAPSPTSPGHSDGSPSASSWSGTDRSAAWTSKPGSATSPPRSPTPTLTSPPISATITKSPPPGCGVIRCWWTGSPTRKLAGVCCEPTCCGGWSHCPRGSKSPRRVCPSAHRAASSPRSAPSTPTWLPGWVAATASRCAPSYGWKTTSIEAATRRTTWWSAASALGCCGSAPTCGPGRRRFAHRRGIRRLRRSDRPVESGVAPAESTADREGADAGVAWTDAPHLALQVVDLDVVERGRGNRPLNDVATLDESRLPAGGVDGCAEHDRIAFTAVDVLDDAVRHPLRCRRRAHKERRWEVAFDGPLGRRTQFHAVRPQPGQTCLGLGQKPAQTIKDEQAAVDRRLTQAGEDRVPIEPLDRIETIKRIDRPATQGDPPTPGGQIGHVADERWLSSAAQEPGEPRRLRHVLEPAVRRDDAHQPDWSRVMFDPRAQRVDQQAREPTAQSTHARVHPRG